MSTRVEKRILVNVPVSTAYNQWTQFEDFPHFMGGVKKVTQLSDDRLEWVAEIAGVKRKWEAKILEQVPDRKVAWAATEGATNAGSVEFEDVGGGQTSIRLFIDYEPEGLVEKVGDRLHVVDHQAEADLKRFKEFIEAEEYASGAWRGSVNESASVGTAGTSGTSGAGGSPLTDETIAHPFDQTSGLIDDEGDSDETAASDTRSAAERDENADRAPGTIPPITGSPGQH